MEDILVNIIAAFILMVPLAAIATVIILLVKNYRKKHPKRPIQISKREEQPKQAIYPQTMPEEHHELTKEEKKALKRQYKEEDYENSPVRMVEHHTSHKEYWYHVHGLNYPNEEGDNILAILEEITSRVKYDTYSGSLKITSYNGDPAVKVYIWDGQRLRHIGWIPADKAETVIDMLRRHECDISLDVHVDYQTKATFVDVLIGY